MTARAPVTGKISPAKTGAILLFLLTIWVTFTVWPSHQEAGRKTHPLENASAAKLRAVGLPDNPDWDGLPEIFTIWADRAEWKDNRTMFAYWHPVMKTYSYFFQATRSNGHVRFREISEPHDPAYHWDESLTDDCPIRFYIPTVAKPSVSTPEQPMAPPPTVANPDKVKIDMSAPAIVTPETPQITVTTRS